MKSSRYSVEEKRNFCGLLSIRRVGGRLTHFRHHTKTIFSDLFSTPARHLIIRPRLSHLKCQNDVIYKLLPLVLRLPLENISSLSIFTLRHPLCYGRYT